MGALPPASALVEASYSIGPPVPGLPTVAVTEGWAYPVTGFDDFTSLGA